MSIPNSANFTNLAAGTLTGGTYIAAAGSTLNFGSRTFSSNAAKVTLDGVGSTFAAVASLAGNSGTFEINHGRNFTTVGSLSNSGRLRVGQGSILTINGTLTNTGIINGKGRIITTGVMNAGSVAPGDSPGLLTISGNYTQTSTGTLDIEVGGTTPGDGYDVLSVSGTATLGGTLNITFVNGFVPSPSDTFDFFDFAATPLGQFSQVNVPPLPPGMQWDVQSLATGGPTTVPEPAAAIASMLLLPPLATLRRRRRRISCDFARGL